MALARWQATIVNEAGDIQPGASIEVRQEIPGAPLALLYSDRGGTIAIGNPFTADTEGFAAFHAAGGAMRITATLGGFSRVWRYVGVGTASEFDNAPLDDLTYGISDILTKATDLHPSATHLLIEGWPGGGGGALSAGAGGAQGGGGGGYEYVIVEVIDLAAAETITIGDGGEGATISPAKAQDGGATSFGSFLTVTGGIGGRSGSGDGTGGGLGGGAGGAPDSPGDLGAWMVSGGGGGGGTSTASTTGGAGADAYLASGGGGGSSTSGAPGAAPGGASRGGGAGGAGGVGSTNGGDGQTPGGGGGATDAIGTEGGWGAPGRIRIRSFPFWPTVLGDF